MNPKCVASAGEPVAFIVTTKEKDMLFEEVKLMEAKTWYELGSQSAAIGQEINALKFDEEGWTVDGRIRIRPMNTDESLSIDMWAHKWDDARQQAGHLRGFANMLLDFADRYESEARDKLAAQEKDNG